MIELLGEILIVTLCVGAACGFVYGFPSASRVQYRYDVMEAMAREVKAQQPQKETPPPEPCQEEGVSRWELLKGD